MSIRYINALLGATAFSGIYCNRGTSGIDGCVSTAIGAAIASNLPTLLILGDVSFLYDRNGFLIRQLPQNLKIIVLNNSGGNIFRMIDGPGNEEELAEYFETRHSFNAQLTCQDACIHYFPVKTSEELEDSLTRLFKQNEISLLEIFTDPKENERIWKDLKAQCKALRTPFTDNV